MYLRKDPAIGHWHRVSFPGTSALPAGKASLGLIEAASTGARVAARARLALDQDEAEARRQIVDRLLRDIEAESYGQQVDAALVSAVERAVASVYEAMEQADLLRG